MARIKIADLPKDAKLTKKERQTITGGPRLRGFPLAPWLLSGVIAAAVAVPVALHNSNSNDGDP